MKKEKSFYEYLQLALAIAKEYFIDSEEKYKACLLLFMAFITVIGIVALSAAFSWWWVLFWAAFEAKTLSMFFFSMEVFTAIALGYVVLKSTYKYLIGLLKANWRNWFTKQIVNEYLNGSNNFLELSRDSEKINNPAQRIHEDVNYFVDSCIDLMFDFFRSALIMITFITTLWVIGGPLGLTIWGIHLVIPGYLVWIALSLSILATYIKYRLGTPLLQLNNQKITVEADFRSELEYIPKEAESIALEQGQHYYQNSLDEKLKKIYATSLEKINVDTSLEAFDSLYDQFSWIFPYLAATPIYFSGVIGLGTLMQIGSSFGEVNASFSWFMNSFNSIAWLKTNINRITELRDRIKSDKDPDHGIKIVKSENTTSILIEKLKLLRPNQEGTIAENLSIDFCSKENVIILGPSGLGKSSIFKAIAGTWRYGEGKITIPAHQKLCFLAQKPSLPKTTLKKILSYPNHPLKYEKNDYEEVLRTIGDMEEFIPQLDIESDWGCKLSGGQLQKIAFARVLLQKPQWLFLDESTSALDPESEAMVYNLIRSKLQDTTFVSIAHRDSVKQFHKKCVVLEKEKNQIAIGHSNTA